jgi:hypothetical protein
MVWLFSGGPLTTFAVDNFWLGNAVLKNSPPSRNKPGDGEGCQWMPLVEIHEKEGNYERKRKKEKIT